MIAGAVRGARIAAAIGSSGGDPPGGGAGPVMVDPDDDPTGLRLCLGAPTRSDLEQALKILTSLAAGEGEGEGI